MAPAEPDQIIAQGGGQIAHRAVGIDAERAVALRQLRAVRPVDQRDVRHGRHAPAQRVVDVLLTGGVDQMIVAADDMGHAHVVIVHHHREHVGRGAVRAQQHQIVEVLVLPDHAALNLVLDHGLAALRRLEADHGPGAGRRLGRIAVAPAAVVAHGAALGFCRLAHRRQFLRRRVTAIGLAFGQELFGDLAVPGGAAELVDGLAVPFDAEPAQPVENGRDCGVGRAFAVGILDPQQHLAAALAGIEPVEKGGARAADMEESGRRGRKAGDDGFGHFRWFDRSGRGWLAGPLSYCRGTVPASRMQMPPQGQKFVFACRQDGVPLPTFLLLARRRGFGT